MEKTYSPAQIESSTYERWEREGYFAAQGGEKSYCIMIPPPNVTGSLHMGHAFQNTLMDLLIRYHRMQGDNTLWQGGTDHAGIATQMVVERMLNQTGKTRHDLGRDAFVEKIWQWKATSGGNITHQLRRLGASIDWSRERFTMDAGLTEAVQEVFIRLYREGLIYRGQRLVNWDPVLKTAVSDLEVESEEEAGTLWHIRYPRTDGTGYIIVATTRPETLFGDVAVAVHPDDTRYQDLIGHEVTLPLANRPIPVIADDMVEMTFGTGCVKITPAHDFRDYAVGQRHGLPLINILNHDACLNEEVPAAYRGLERFKAREKAVAELTALGLIEKIEPYLTKIPRSDRTRAVLEPYLTHQWFVKTQSLAAEAIGVVERGEINFVPDNWKNTYFDWMNRIEDWCISRQIWWGHRIPAWYDEEGNAYVGRTEAEVREHYKLSSTLSIKQDDDVLDTWFSSALWPFSTLGWPKQTDELKTFYPTSVLVTGFDIIFFWVARMIMFGRKFTGQIPFKTVYIHGLIRDAEGHKMSKSKGNVLDPLDLIDGITLEALVEKRTQGLMQPQMAKKITEATRTHYPEGIPSFGTDALRFTFCALASTGRNIRFDLKRIEGYRNFCNKLWNAARFVLLNSEGVTLPNALPETAAQTPADAWILHALANTNQQVQAALTEYRFDFAAQHLYEFCWHQFCDWYLELAKVQLAKGDAERANTCRVLLEVLETFLRMAHPLIPFITETLWLETASRLGKAGKTIMLASYPKVTTPPKTQTVIQMEQTQQLILAIRQIRSEASVSPAIKAPLLLKCDDALKLNAVLDCQAYIKALAKIDNIKVLSLSETPPVSAAAVVDGIDIFIPLAGLIDKNAETERLQKEIHKMREELTKVQEKLANTSFVERAPAVVVDKERTRAVELTDNVTRLQGELQRIEAL